MLQASSHGGEEEGSVQLKLEYMSGPEMPEEGPGEPKLGRNLLIPLRLHLLPSLQVPLPPETPQSERLAWQQTAYRKKHDC